MHCEGRLYRLLEAAPCCGHKESADPGGYAAARAAPCCERVTFQIEHIPGAESPAPRPPGALLGLVVTILAAPSATPGVSAVAVNRGPAANSAGPPIFLETCSLLI